MDVWCSQYIDVVNAVCISMSSILSVSNLWHAGNETSNIEKRKLVQKEFMLSKIIKRHYWGYGGGKLLRISHFSRLVGK